MLRKVKWENIFGGKHERIGIILGPFSLRRYEYVGMYVEMQILTYLEKIMDEKIIMWIIIILYETRFSNNNYNWALKVFKNDETLSNFGKGFEKIVMRSRQA